MTLELHKEKSTDLYFLQDVGLNMIVHVMGVYSSAEFGDFPLGVLTD